jgi:hypothetical protein
MQALLSQLRVLDSARLDNGRKTAKIGIVKQKDFETIKRKIHELVG